MIDIMLTPLSSFSLTELASPLSPQVRGKLRSCLITDGAFILSKHNISLQLFNEFERVNNQFFALSQCEKDKFSKVQFPLTGYKKYKSENLAKFLGQGDYPDLCEKYSWNESTNCYPDLQFKYIYDTYFQAMKHTSKAIFSAIKEVLDSEINCDENDWNQLIKGHQLIRHLNYPQNSEDQNLSMAAHHDLGCFSMINQNNQKDLPTLEVKLQNQYIPITTEGTELIILLGEVFRHISQGKIQAAKHRVVNSCHRSKRSSTICFVNPHPDFNLRKHRGSNFDGQLKDHVQTYGQMLEQDLQEYVNA